MCFGTLIHQIYCHGSNIHGQLSRCCSYQLTIATTADGTWGRIAKWLPPTKSGPITPALRALQAILNLLLHPAAFACWIGL